MAKNTRTMVPVTRRALIQRVNRKLKPDGEILRTYRSMGYGCGVQWEAGDLFRVNANNSVEDLCVDLEYLARKVGALAEWETLAE